MKDMSTYPEVPEDANIVKDITSGDKFRYEHIRLFILYLFDIL